ncbi:GntR family transcriptional regulator [Agromyces soli]
MPHATAVERVTAALRDEILSGALAPGSPLREELAAERFEVSRHTVRAAFQRLVAERLAEAEAYRGVRVTSFGTEQVLALQQLRAALESEAVRIAAERFGAGPWPDAAVAPAEAALLRLEKMARSARGDAAAGAAADDEAAGTAAAGTAADAPDWLEVERIHAEFHRALVEASGSPRIVEAHAALGSELLLFLLHVRPHYSLDGLVREHRELLAAVQRAGGADAMRAHLAGSAALLVGGAAGAPVTTRAPARTRPGRAGD